MEQKNFQPEVSAPPPSPVVQEEPTGFPIRLALGVFGGLLGAIIGGLVWGLIMGPISNYLHPGPIYNCE